MPSLWELVRYFLYLGSLGFGGPVALVGYMQRDLVEQRKRFSKDDYMKGLALLPLAAQLAICLGYVHSKVTGATLVALAFTLPSYLMTVGISMLYVRYGGLTWMQAAFYGVGAAVIGIIVRAAYKLGPVPPGGHRLRPGGFVVGGVGPPPRRPRPAASGAPSAPASRSGRGSRCRPRWCRASAIRPRSERSARSSG